mmetsp:Transcript_88025/g.226985  ORF Transcript_88025/g.226985 Transcript_88025/m.226985 type:complete len:376 (+) Transcript_88025:120-1247(+)
MCFPPFCQPATHFLGCFGLRHGAAIMVAANALYGLSLVVLHALLLGETEEPPGLAEERLLRRLYDHLAEDGMRPGEVGGMPGSEFATHSGRPRHPTESESTSWGREHQHTSWMLQFVDLDIGFGHQLFGLDDSTNLISGLVWGVVVVAFSVYALQAVLSPGAAPARTSRWMVALLHFELMLFVMVSLAKLPKLCKMQELYLHHLEMECGVLKFIFVERVVFMLIIASLCTWVFSSYAFVLTLGHGAAYQMDKPEYSSQVELQAGGDAKGAYMTRGPPASMGAGPGPGFGSSMAGGHPAAPASRHSMSMVGGAVRAGSHSLRPPPHSSSYASQGPAHSTSYNVGRMPRASSSMQTSSTARGDPEMQSLIRPPVAMY